MDPATLVPERHALGEGQAGRSGAPVRRLHPLPLWQAVVLFGVSALVARLCVYGLLPALLDGGVTPFWAFLGSYSLFLSLMILAALVGFRREGHPWTVQAFTARFRFRSLSGRAWLWTLGLFVAGFVGSGLLLPTQQAIASIPAFAPPDFLPALLNPLATQSLAPAEFLGVALRGNWWVALVFAAFLIGFNILGEELWFRGYILPRQELSQGRWTWAVHGILWTLFHLAIYPWVLIALLPTALSVSFAAQRLRNTWAAAIVHFLGNGLLALLPIVLGIVGVGS